MKKCNKKTNIQKNKKSVSDNRIESVDHDIDDVAAILHSHYGNAKCYLNHENAWQLLIATILSAQCTDARVNVITDKLFKKYPALKDLAGADLSELEYDIRTAGFYHSKSKNIKACAQALLDRFGGEVPPDMDDLTSLPGVGRKTANVIRSNIFDIPSIAVDTHVKRITKRLGFTESDDPEQIECDLMRELPKKDWSRWNLEVIAFGREICKAQNPECDKCFLAQYCKADIGKTK